MKKTVLITGASGDIGASIANKFASNGYNIVYHYNKNLNQPVISALSKKTNVLPMQADLTKKTDIENLLSNAIKTFGKIDVLINNAGVSHERLSIDESYESISDVISTNLVSAIYLTSLAIPNLSENASIVNISSIWGEFGGSGETTYSASKGGLISYTKALSQELGASGIRVNAVAPGWVNTDMNADLPIEFVDTETDKYHLQRWAEPEEIADAIVYLASDKATYITGQVLILDGGHC